MNMSHVEELFSPDRIVYLSTNRHMNEHMQQYDLSRSLANKRSFLLNFLAQIEQLIVVAFSIDGFNKL